MKFDHDIEIKHQLPQKRTIQFENKLFYIQFPIMLFLKIENFRFYPIAYKENECLPLHDVLPNIFGDGLCISEIHIPDMDKLISYFWESPFTKIPIMDWKTKLKRLENNPYWFLHNKNFLYKNYLYPIGLEKHVHQAVAIYHNKFLKGLKNEV